MCATEDDPALPDPLRDELVAVLTAPSGVSSAGYPYLERAAWERFRDRVPHLLGMGLEVHRRLDRLEAAPPRLPRSQAENLERGIRVARQVVMTAAITAPPDLWLVRQVLGTLSGLGLLTSLLEGEAIYPESTVVGRGSTRRRLDPVELAADLRFLLARGILDPYDDSYRLAGHPRVRSLVRDLGPTPAFAGSGASFLWRRLFAGEQLAPAEIEILLDLGATAFRRLDTHQNHWVPTTGEVELGFRLVPVVLGLRASGRELPLVRDACVRAAELSPVHPTCAHGAAEILAAAGWLERRGEEYRVTAIGARGFERGPGPFGIIEAYRSYLEQGAALLLGEARGLRVSRGDNLGASQAANRATFERANDALDRFCRDHGFTYRVFVEHAIGRGEATRQRYERSGPGLTYVGADLEDAAIDAAEAERAAGRLPAEMVFLRAVDIGRPELLVAGLERHGADPERAVMLVGNGFHEIRDQTDEGMIEVFRGYERAGLLLIFTEESALSIDDLRATAWNTYHAGFKYVHEKSGQGLRPAEPRPPSRLGRPLRASWSACAEAAGYVRLEAYSNRTRTIYPHPPPGGYNPAISVSHFVVPRRLARRLGLGERSG